MHSSSNCIEPRLEHQLQSELQDSRIVGPGCLEETAGGSTARVARHNGRVPEHPSLHPGAVIPLNRLKKGSGALETELECELEDPAEASAAWIEQVVGSQAA